MCGIAGIIDPRGPGQRDLDRMLAAIRHRGPDDEGSFVAGPAALGNRRLSIIDLAHGRQPLRNEDGTLWIVFNGEIYNYRELRSGLEEKGHRFLTDTDTETILHLYEELGDECVRRLRGMFAFAIWDARKGRLFAARDRLGQKPFFYLQSGGTFLFASEIKALLTASGVSARLDANALHGFLCLRFVPAPLTMFEGIRSLPPAHTLTLEDGQVRTERYWNLTYLPKWRDSEEDLVDRLEELLAETVRLHLVSDVPVGAFLSGGIDSSLMTDFVARELGSGFPTFSIGSDAEDFNELPAARVLARRLGTEHHEQVVRPDLVQLLPEMVHHLDMPGDPIAACQYHVARLAAQHVKVSIGGDGGDELFGGYDRFAGFRYVDMYAALPEVFRRRIIGPLLDLAGDSFTYKSTVSKLRWLQSLSFHENGERYAEATAYFRFDREGMSALYGPRMRGALEGSDPRRPLVEAFDAADADEVVDRMLHADATTRLPEHLLILLDRMTMAHSLEGRSPLLDHEVAEFAARLPVRTKVRGRRLKYLLRRVAERRLPEEISRRPKQGFMFPIAYWLQGELSHLTRTVLRGSRFAEEGYFDPASVETLLDEHEAGKVDHHHRLWMLLNLDMWFRHYLDGEGVEALIESLHRQKEDSRSVPPEASRTSRPALDGESASRIGHGAKTG